MIVTLRDGLIADEKKRIRKNLRNSKKLESTLVNMAFGSWCVLMDHISLTGEYHYLYQIRDPYALMLILGIYENVELPSVEPDENLYDDTVSCHEVWTILKRKNPEKITNLMRRINSFEQKYFYQISSGKNIEGITVKRALRQIAEYRQYFFEDAYATWIVQPDPEAIAFAIISDFTDNNKISENYRISPVLGVPINMAQPRIDEYRIRFPCLVSQNWFNEGERIQIHKSLGEIRVFDITKNPFELTSEQEEQIQNIGIDGLFDGLVRDDGTLFLYDIICINDIWIYNRPLSERNSFFWHFGDLLPQTMIVYNWKELEQFEKLSGDDNALIRNLNRAYCPVLRDAWIFSRTDVVQALIYKDPSADIFTLRTSDNVVLFILDVGKITSEEIGRVVDVNKEGMILRYRFDLLEPQSWDEIKASWNIEKPDNKKIGWGQLEQIIQGKN